MTNVTIPSWVAIRNIGNTRVAKSSYAFPLIGYFVIFNEYFVEIFRKTLPLDHSIHGGATNLLPYVYFGLLSFSLASIIYAAFCPEIIKEFGSELKFVLSTKSTLSSDEFLRYCSAIQQHLAESPIAQRARGAPTILKEQGISALKEDLLLDVQKAFYFHKATERAGARCASTVLYALGFILLSIPTITGIIRVFSAILSQ